MVDKVIGIHADTRSAWFKADFGQQLLAEYTRDLDAYSKTRLTLSRHRWLTNMIKIATGDEKQSPPNGPDPGCNPAWRTSTKAKETANRVRMALLGSWSRTRRSIRTRPPDRAPILT